MCSDGVTARFDDRRDGRAWVFGAPDRVLEARRLDEVRDVLAAVDQATLAGAWAWGYVSYEAAPAFDSALQVRSGGSNDLPLVSFAIGPPPTKAPVIGEPSEPNVTRPNVTGNAWDLDCAARAYVDRVEHIRRAIAAGDAYQVNLTSRLVRQHHDENPMQLYARLAHAECGSYNAYIDLDNGSNTIVSVSPELFFLWDDSGLTTRPMKGTARRGRTTAEDEFIRAELLNSPKQRAENVMIVDILRNDLSRLARPGSVRVSSLLDAERYATVWQLTSTITCEPATGTTLAKVFAALFPSGSITGAPKASAMGLIADLETSTRGVYCGAVGMVAPPGSEFRARFAVAIRTATINWATGLTTYGAGGGITWSSDPDEEYDELLAKADILSRPAAGTFRLLETLRLRPPTVLRNLERHLARLLDSAHYFDIPIDLAHIRARLRDAVYRVTGYGPHRVRILLAGNGQLRIEVAPLDTSLTAVTLALDTEPTVTSCWTQHKTTHRDHYRAAAQRHPEVDDVVLFNESGHVTETTKANLAVKIDGRWYTPPLTSGCLPGIERQRLIETGRLYERDLVPTDLSHGRQLAVISSLRGWRAASVKTGSAPSHGQLPPEVPAVIPS